MIFFTAFFTGMVVGYILKDIINQHLRINVKPSHESKREIIDKVIELVAKASCITVEQLKSNTRKRDVVVARQFAMYMIKKTLRDKVTWNEVSEPFGKDHTTAIYAFKSTETYLDVKDAFVVPLHDRYKKYEATG